MNDYGNGNGNNHMVSDNHTHGGSDRYDGEHASWNNYSGNSGSHNVQADQMNYKESDGTHYFYNTQTGAQGVALGSERQRDW